MSGYWIGETWVERAPRLRPEHDLETRLVREYAERDNVLSVRRQVRCEGGQRADIVLLEDLGDDFRILTVVEVKVNAANLITLRQVLRYIAFFRRTVDDRTAVRGVIAAPRFTAALKEWMGYLEDDGFLCLDAVTL